MDRRGAARASEVAAADGGAMASRQAGRRSTALSIASKRQSSGGVLVLSSLKMDMRIRCAAGVCCRQSFWTFPGHPTQPRPDHAASGVGSQRRRGSVAPRRGAQDGQDTGDPGDAGTGNLPRPLRDRSIEINWAFGSGPLHRPLPAVSAWEPRGVHSGTAQGVSNGSCTPSGPSPHPPPTPLPPSSHRRRCRTGHRSRPTGPDCRPGRTATACSGPWTPVWHRPWPCFPWLSWSLGCPCHQAGCPLPCRRAPGTSIAPPARGPSPRARSRPWQGPWSRSSCGRLEGRTGTMPARPPPSMRRGRGRAARRR